ncbi:sigma-70 family RNA polymerase sigma factor [Actinomarinicola tropica]|uniref:Sigma-70 family RNA polymerase sigma factor n=1 Tax=Actinomarinicola tropica TaxID=2789776 RepID=A0A5Q2RG99_9ACTN|nr:sigma-70 family RNA polymerase sigma factor [Actinomarinicola tropica]QGG94664.1 sigma-70 family RNA polymerase sigma factor [Actinomarinicola tropica]
MEMTAQQRELVDSHLPLVEHLVLRVSANFPRHVDRSELIAAGSLGLVEAAMRYDGDRGVPFGRYAARRIRGAVLDAVRAADWAPRSTRQLARQADAATQAFAARTGRTPTDEELADELGIEAAELAEMRGRVHRGVVQSLEPRAGQDEGANPLDRLFDRSASGADEHLEQEELRGYLRSALEHLPERHRIVVVGHYFEQRSFDELADFLGVTPSRVSQLRADAVEMIKDGIEAQYRPKDDAKPVGRVAIRQARFAAEIASHADWRTRLDPGTRSMDAIRELGIDGLADTAVNA